MIRSHLIGRFCGSLSPVFLMGGVAKLASALFIFIATPLVAVAVPYGGMDFPGGESSFVDSVIRYDPGGNPTPTSNTDPTEVLGVPDGSSGVLAFSSNGALLELLFENNFLTNSGTSADDLRVFTVGLVGDERISLAVRPSESTLALLDPALDANGDGFFEIGNNSNFSVDIDSFFTGFAANSLLFDAVQISNVAVSEGVITQTNIDAVGAISSLQPVTVPEPYSLSLLMAGLMGVRLLKRKR